MAFQISLTIFPKSSQKFLALGLLKRQFKMDHPKPMKHSQHSPNQAPTSPPQHLVRYRGRYMPVAQAMAISQRAEKRRLWVALLVVLPGLLSLLWAVTLLSH